MLRLGRIRLSHTGRVLSLLVALTVVLLAHVSATLAADPLTDPKLKLERDLAAVRVQLDALPARFIETAIGELSFNTAIGNGDPEHHWQTVLAMTHAAQREAAGLRQALLTAAANESADLALLIGVQLSNIERAIAAWRVADASADAEAAILRAREALDRANAVLVTLGLQGGGHRESTPAEG
jgi:hypothetical protein